MLATLKTTGMSRGDVVVDAHGQVGGVITWQEVPASQMESVQPTPYNVAQALMLRDAVGSANIAQTVARWTKNPKL